MPAHDPGRSLDRIAPARRLIALVTVGLAALGASGQVDGASPEPVAAGQRFESARLGYVLSLPPGWEFVDESLAREYDEFRGPGLYASVHSTAIEPGQTLDDRLAMSRSADPNCTSDPSAAEPATLGGETAIRWSTVCPASMGLFLSALHGPRVYHLIATVPLGSEALAAPLLDQLSASFAFTDAGVNTLAGAGTLTDMIQGTWQNAWHPFSLEFAAVRAAGLGDELDASAWRGFVDPEGSTRSAVKFDGTEIIQYGALDGSGYDVGWFGTFEPVDADTIAAAESGTFTRIVYDLELHDDVLSVDVVSDSDAEDFVIQTAIYETLPFTRVP